MKLHGKIESSTVNGPGNRAVIWFQGCTLNCPGCHNPETHSFAGHDVYIERVMEWLRGLRGIEGVTFTGGEPMQHFLDLKCLIVWLRHVRPELSIGMFTGYSIKELWRMKEYHSVRRLLDFAVCGRYNAQKPRFNSICSSYNQTLELLSRRYTIEDFAQQGRAEVTIDGDLVQISGFPGIGFKNGVKTL